MTPELIASVSNSAVVIIAAYTVVSKLGRFELMVETLWAHYIRNKNKDEK